jgi:hypothetical protein
VWMKRGIGGAGLCLAVCACSSQYADHPVPGSAGQGRIAVGGSGADPGGGAGGASLAQGNAGAEASGRGGVQPQGNSGSAGASGTPISTAGAPSGSGGNAPGGGAPSSTGGSSSAGGSRSAGGESGGKGGAPCVDLGLNTVSFPPVLEFVIDVTGSMNQPAYPSDPSQTASKWDEMKRVLPQVLSGMPADWAVGVSFFNLPLTTTTAPDTCFAGRQLVPIAPLSNDQRTLIERAIVDETPTGATPTLAAWQFGLSQVTGWNAPAQYAKSNRSVVLITDGIPTINNHGCYGGTQSASNGTTAIAEAEYDGLMAAVRTDGTRAGVNTFVIGVLGSENPQGALYDPLFKLSQLAMAGGTAQPATCTPSPGISNGTSLTTRGSYCHFDMTTNADFARGLQTALKSVVILSTDCSFEVPPPPAYLYFNPAGISVTYTPANQSVARKLLEAPNGNCAVGQWYSTKTDVFGVPMDVQLCPDTCATVANDVGASVHVTLLCMAPL